MLKKLSLVWKNRFYLSIRPTVYLISVGLLVTAFFGSFVIWLMLYPEGSYLGIKKGDVSNWGTLLAAYVALIGWLCTSYITTRNSIKQYTITTLLQSRLSAEYMTHAKALNKALVDRANIKSKMTITSQFVEDEANADIVMSMGYALNYFDFVSAGIRCGDFDEKLLKLTQKGMFIMLYETCEPYIEDIQKKSEDALEHYSAVYRRWSKSK